MSKVLGLRVDEDLAEWAKSYAESRGVTTQALLEQAVRSFKEDCDSGVPEIRARARRQSGVRPAEEGVGVCPKRADGLGHVWSPVRTNPLRPCVHCGLPGRGDDQKSEHGYIASAGSERAEMFQEMAIPMVSGSGNPEKAWPRGMPPSLALRAAEIRAAKSARDQAAKP